VPDPRSVGDLIGVERKLAGLTQEQLAQKASYSVSLVRAVEQGREPASPGFIAAAARALDIEPEQLTGTPYRDTIEEDGPLLGMAELRAIMAEGTYVRAVQPGTLAEMAAEMDNINLAYRNDKGRQALRRLPVLIRQLHGAAHSANTDTERARVYSLLSSAYVTAERLCRRFGFMSLTTPAVDRLEWCAERADDQVYVAQAKVKRGRVLMYLDSTDVALSLVEQGLDELDQVGGGGEPVLAVRGWSHLCGAIAAARGRQHDVARAHIKEARKFAAQVNGESEAYGTLFGTANVDIHSCAVELEAGNPGKAAREGSDLRLPKDIAPPRAGYHWQDTARAWLMSGEPAKALDALNMARRVAPQQTRLHPSVRETLRGIATVERRRTESLTSFVGWVGLKL
jgi:transcriptional regulator with XRE-family HTH domain